MPENPDSWDELTFSPLGVQMWNGRTYYFNGPTGRDAHREHVHAPMSPDVLGQTEDEE